MEEIKIKTRNCFVSNSSSSSFIVEKYSLTDEQEDMIRNHKHWGPIIQEKISSDNLFKVVCGCPSLNAWSFGTEHGNAWRVQENDKYFFLDTYLDNFDMEEYLKVIHADQDIVGKSDIDDKDKDSLRIANKLISG